MVSTVNTDKKSHFAQENSPSEKYRRFRIRDWQKIGLYNEYLAAIFVLTIFNGREFLQNIFTALAVQQRTNSSNSTLTSRGVYCARLQNAEPSFLKNDISD